MTWAHLKVGMNMELSIGIARLAREVNIETDSTEAEIQAQVLTALSDGSPLKIVTSKGRTVIVPGSAIAYVQFGTEEKRSVGFGQA